MTTSSRGPWRVIFLAAIGLAVAIAIVGAAGAAADVDNGVEANTIVNVADDAVFDGPDADATGTVPLMIELTEPATSKAFASARGKGASRGAAVAAAKTQKLNVARAQDALLKRLEGKRALRVLYAVQSAFDGVAVEAPAASMDELRSLPGVKAVSRIALVHRDNASTVPMIGAPTAWQSYGKTGDGIRIGIIDTGIDYVHVNFGGPGTGEALNAARGAAANPQVTGPTDPAVAGFTVSDGATQLYPSAKVAGGFDFAGDAYNADSTSPSFNPTPRTDPNPEDCPSALGGGHGSHVSGSAAGYGVNADGTTYAGPFDTSAPLPTLRIGPGVAPQATLYGLRVFGCAGSSALATQAIDWATDPNQDGDPSDHLDVLNMSLGVANGTPDDASAAASDSAAALGVVVVASSGNNNDVFYVSGTPGSATRALTVAAVADDFDITDGLRVNAPADIANVYGASRSSVFNWAPGVMTPRTGNVYYPATNQYGCSAFTATEAAKVSGRILLVDWKQPPDATFPCGSAQRANNATVAGALGMIMVDATPFLDTTIAGNASTPAMYTTSLVGNLLKSKLTPGVVSTVSVTLTAEYNDSVRLVTPGRADTVSTFSSRGPRGRDSIAKPDIAAPGQGVFSTDAGTGTFGRTLNGTSMAAPHMAGVMALLRQTHPSWSVEQLKALAMNTAAHDTFTGLDASGDRYGVARVGAGRVDVPNAFSTDVVAYDADRTGAVSVSFGALEVAGTLTQDRTVKVVNNGSLAAAYAISYDARTTVPGVSYSFPDGDSVAVEPGDSATFRVRLTAVAAQLRNARESTVAAAQANNPRQWLNEAGGNVILTPESATALRVPVYAVVRPASQMTTLEAALPTAATSVLHLTGQDVITAGAAQHNSLVTPFELQGESPLATLPGGFSPLARNADLKAIGVTTDSKARPPASVGLSQIYFGLSTWGNWSTPATEIGISVFIDTNRDGTDDFQLFNTRFTDSDVFLTVLTRLSTGSQSPQSFLNGVNSNVPTAIFNSNAMTLPVAAGALGLSAANTRFNYRIVTTSRFWGIVDSAGPFTYDIANPGVDFSNGPTGVPLYLDRAGATLPVRYNATAFAANGDTGILLLHHFNASGNRDQVLRTAAVAATSVSVSGAAQYSDTATLTATVSPASNAGSSISGTVTFRVNGSTVGTAAVAPDGTATLPFPVSLAAGSYPVTATFASGNSLFGNSSGSGSLTVTREDATVTPPAANAATVAVTAAGSNASKPFTLAAEIAEVADGSSGDISRAEPVTFTLNPVIAGGGASSCTATLTVSAGIETATCTFSGIAVNVYDVAISVGGSYYTGTGQTVVTVFDPSVGNVVGGGWILHGGNRANFGLNVSYTKNGNVKGSLLYVEHAPSGDVVVKSTALQSAAVSGSAAVLQGKAVVNGVGNYSFRAVATDNGEPGADDAFGLQAGDISFAPVILGGGNIRVP